jgi:hypothetical protein
MAAAEKHDNSWLTLQKRREERMRFEVLFMIYEAAEGCADLPLEASSFVKRLGLWEQELEKVLRFLSRRGYINRIEPDSSIMSVTVTGVDYIERDSVRRRTIRD